MATSASLTDNDTSSRSEASRHPGYVAALPSTLKTHVEKETIAESYQQYLLVKHAGNLQDTCTYAGVVVFAMIQAKDKKDYQDWKEIQRNDCALTGMKIPQ